MSRKRSFDVQNTPLKPRFHTTNRARTNYFTIKAEIHHEMKGGVFANTPNFLSKFFPADEDLVARIKKDLCIDGSLLDKDGKWIKLPRSPIDESKLYEPFVKILAYIHHRCPEDQRHDIIWRSNPNKAPDSEFDFDWKPDAVAELDASPKENAKWTNILFPIEIKKAHLPIPALPQLIGYARGTLREQPNRRFIYGFTLCKTMAQVWLFDRSGALGSQQFDVHSNPDDLIRVIVGFSMKPLDELGYDPTFTSYVSKNKTDAQTPEGAYQSLWKVTGMKVEGMDESLILFEAISLAHAEVLRGRSSRIWKAWLEKEMGLDRGNREIFIFKDEWRDGRREHEGKLYEKATPGRGLARVCSAETVTINGRLDETLSLIRQSIRPKGKPLLLPHPGGKEAFTQSPPSPLFDTHIVPQVTVDNFPEDKASGQYHPRTHSRLLLRSFGWPLTRFRNLSELLYAVRDAVAGHKHAYDHDVLHRDISLGNVIINAKRSEDNPDHGFLIDFNYGRIITKDYVPIEGDDRTGTAAFMSAEMLRQKRIFRPEILLDTDDVNIEANAGDKGTNNDTPQDSHIHDLESVFWLLCWICLFRKGPSSRREEFHRQPQTDYERKLHLLFQDLFEAPYSEMGKAKQLILESTGEFTDLRTFFHPYFWPLRKPITDLYAKLRTAYQQRSFGTLYTDFLTILGDAAKAEESRQYDTDGGDLMEKEVQRRKDELKGWTEHPIPSWDPSPRPNRTAHVSVDSSSSPGPTTPTNPTFPDAAGGRGPQLFEQDSPTPIGPTAKRPRK